MHCVTNLRKSYEFLRLCVDSENTLQSYVKELKNASSFELGPEGRSRLADLLDTNFSELHTDLDAKGYNINRVMECCYL